MRRSSCLTTRGNSAPGVIAAIGVAVLSLAATTVTSAESTQEIRERPLETIAIPRPRAAPVVGERLQFHGRWFGIPVGHGWIEVKALTELNGIPAYLIEAEGHSNDFLSVFYPVQDMLRSYLDAATLRPLRFEKFQREGHYRAEEIVTFDYAQRRAHYESLLNHSTKEIEIPDALHDIVSAFYWLRTQPTDLTHPITLQIYSDEKVYETEFQPQKMVMLELLRRGTFPCVLIEPKAAFKGVFVRRGRVWCYLSADERRLPLFVKISTPWGPMAGILDAESIQQQPQPQP